MVKAREFVEKQAKAKAKVEAHAQKAAAKVEAKKAAAAKVEAQKAAAAQVEAQKAAVAKVDAGYMRMMEGTLNKQGPLDKYIKKGMHPQLVSKRPAEPLSGEKPAKPPRLSTAGLKKLSDEVQKKLGGKDEYRMALMTQFQDFEDEDDDIDKNDEKDDDADSVDSLFHEEKEEEDAAEEDVALQVEAPGEDENRAEKGEKDIWKDHIYIYI